MLLVAKVMPLELDREAARKDRCEPAEQLSRGVRASRREGARDRALFAAGQAMQPFRVRGDVLPRDAPLPLRMPERAGRDQPTEIPVSRAALDEEGEPTRNAPVISSALFPVIPSEARNPSLTFKRSLTAFGTTLFEGRLRPDERLDSRLPRGLVEPRRSIDAVRVDESDRRETAVRGLLDQVFRKRGTVEKREGRRRAQLGIRAGLLARSGRMPGALPELLFAGTGGDDARVGGLEHPPTLGVNLA